MQRFFRRPLVAALGLIIVGAATIAWWQAHNHSKTGFRTARVKRGDISSTISATGTIEPVEVVDVGAQVAGLIKSFGKDRDGKAIDYGSIVEEGSVLAQIDDSVYAADLGVARAQMEQDKAGELSAGANVEQMEARLTQAEADWNRAQELSRSKLLAQSDFDTYKANYQVTKANVAVAQAALAQAKAATLQGQAAIDKAQRNLDFCTIKSPVKGVIIDRRVNIGQTVVSSLNAPSLFLIAKDLTKMQIWVSVNEADVGRITPGEPVTFSCDAFPGRTFKGTVGKVRLNATMTQNVVMYTVEINTENPENILLPYLTANVRFVVRQELNALLVPNAGLRWSPSSLAMVAPEARSGSSSLAAQSDPPENKGASSKAAKDSGTIWLTDGEFVRPVEVKVGISDGVNAVVLADNLQEGQEVVTGETRGGTQSGTKNPFLPPTIKR